MAESRRARMSDRELAMRPPSLGPGICSSVADGEAGELAPSEASAKTNVTIRTRRLEVAPHLRSLDALHVSLPWLRVLPATSHEMP